ncbi:phosphate ABC transporter permease subunit PstC [Allocoprobacillus halotolerans]|uniref:Phosphate transport system permease protein n=1 Tax=Allocoprobacillus halotolerans TaxID=2944914 RepID=A0ABY5I8G9_9FIRM|nr:phosphate ABC transporter permease subunit PstC [Allocoprobacillus halotolerans]UTY40230.1 phosphate ABC transporter permease subunit PstC [Allocoprobacillus halotolerans]
MASIIANRKTKSIVEKTAAIIFICCAVVSIVAVVGITAYMFVSGTPAIFKVGLTEILFSNVWAPTASDPQYGILNIILTSIVGVFFAILIGVPIGILTAVNLAEIANPKVRSIIKSAVELLAGIPSVVYGLLGILIINPLMYQLELAIYSGSKTHQFTGGANLISAILVLAIMILPTLINITETSLKTVPDDYRKSSLALGASQMQTIFKVVLPAAKNGIMSAIVLGVGRAIGEAMAILLVAGNSVNLPLPFNSVRFLTTGIVSEMGYASGTHREVLFTIGLVLFIFILIINLILTLILKRGGEDGK